MLYFQVCFILGKGEALLRFLRQNCGPAFSLCQLCLKSWRGNRTAMKGKCRQRGGGTITPKQSNVDHSDLLPKRQRGLCYERRSDFLATLWPADSVVVATSLSINLILSLLHLLHCLEHIDTLGQSQSIRVQSLLDAPHLNTAQFKLIAITDPEKFPASP
jgi:hypothetical protein